MDSEGVDPDSEQSGTLALITTAEGCSHRTAWPNPGWGNYLLDFWDDFSDDGQIADGDSEEFLAVGSLAVPLTVAPGSEASVTFLLAWHFPNRLTWDMHRRGDECCSDGGDCCGGSADCCGDGDECRSADANPDWVGNYYATRFDDAWDVAGAATASSKRSSSAASSL